MSDEKKLLSESTIRRFMTLANTGPLSNSFIQENFNEEEITEENEEEVNEDEEIEENLDGENANREADVEEGMGVYARDEEEVPVEDEELEMDMGEPEADAPAAEADMSLSEEEARLLIDLGSRLQQLVGADAAEEEMPMDDMEDLGDVGEPEEEEEEPVMQEQEALVQEVLKRITKKIVSEKLKKNRK